MKKILILCLTLAILVLSGCGNTQAAEQPIPVEPTPQQAPAEPTAAPETPAPEETPAPVPVETEEPIETYAIDFAGLQLKYPEKWKDKVTVTVSDNKAAFVCGDVPLFDLLANSDEGYVLGTVCADEYTVLSVVSYDIADTENADLFAMQEDMNVILQNLMTDYEFVVGEAVEKIDDSTVDIETSVTTLKYPARWKDTVTANVTENGVSFVNYGTSLFDLVFTECDGFLLGTYNDTPIYIVDYPVYSDEQAAMQEDVNVILQHLMEDPNFIINA